MCSDGTWAGGTGATKEESEQSAVAARDGRNAFLAKAPRERLRELLRGREGSEYLLSSDVTHAIRAIAEILGVT